MVNNNRTNLSFLGTEGKRNFSGNFAQKRSSWYQEGISALNNTRLNCASIAGFCPTRFVG